MMENKLTIVSIHPQRQIYLRPRSVVHYHSVARGSDSINGQRIKRYRPFGLACIKTSERNGRTILVACAWRARQHCCDTGDRQQEQFQNFPHFTTSSIFFLFFSGCSCGSFGYPIDMMATGSHSSGMERPSFNGTMSKFPIQHAPRPSVAVARQIFSQAIAISMSMLLRPSYPRLHASFLLPRATTKAPASRIQSLS